MARNVLRINTNVYVQKKEYCYYQCNAITFVILFVYYVLCITPHIKRRTTIKPLKVSKNEQNTDVTSQSIPVN